MSSATSVFIAGCWIAWAAYWLAMAFTTKRTAERGGFYGYRIVVFVIAGVLFAAGRLLHVAADTLLWHTSSGLGVAADAIVLGGVAFTVRARVALGRNWSAEVTFKQGHELIESGPYALARHPIYTGLITMGLGTAIDYGRAIGFGVFVAATAGFWWKARDEERPMSAHFPDAYAAYRARVRAIIPFLL